MQQESALFKALSDPIRLRLTVLLAIQGETCVCDLAAALDEPDYKISRHLGILRSAGLVGARPAGAWMYYRVIEGRTGLESPLCNWLRDQLNDHSVVREDLARLQGARRKKTTCCDER